jgi:uncharacterized protein YbjT (DUF2867 family)
MSRPIIAVFGATGAQGGSLARAILNDTSRRFALRAITRKPGGAAALELASRGADIVTADLDDAPSVERALEGAHGAYFVTNFWEHFSADKELAQARTLAAGAAHTGIRHVIWSTLEDTRQFLPADGARMPVLQGRFNVPHLDAKGEADHIFGQLRVPTTYLRISFYWENLIYFGLGPKPEADGTLAMAMPMGTAKLPGIAVEDIGKAALGLLTRGSDFIGKTVGIAGECLTVAEMAAALAVALGRPVRCRTVSPEQYRALGFPGADELGNMFQFMRDFEREFTGARSLDLSRELNPGVQTFADWLARHKAQIPLS